VSDAPLATRVFTCEFDLRSGCTDYIAQYDDDSESFGSQFRPNSAVQISATKHILYLRASGEDMRMSLVGKRPLKGCSAK
jgi:hypothetical protein